MIKKIIEFMDNGRVLLEQIKATIKKIFPLRELGGNQDYTTKVGATCPKNLLYKRLYEIRLATELSKPEFIQVVHKTYYEKTPC